MLVVFALMACSPPAQVSEPALGVPAGQELVTERLRAGLGQWIRLDLAYDGPWPANLAWEGVDRSEGSTAWIQVTSLGERVVRVEGLERVVTVDPGANRPSRSPLPLDKRPLTESRGTCFDPRFPTLTGSWVLGCENGLVAQAWNVESGAVQTLEPAQRSPGVGSGVAFWPGVGVWRLDEGGFVASKPHQVSPIGPVVGDGEGFVLTTQDAVMWGGLTDGQRFREPAEPASWYAPALADDGPVWVDRREAPLTGLDLYRLVDGQVRVLVRAPGDQRHVAASGPWIAWVEDGYVVVQDTRVGERRRYAAAAHTASGLSLWGPVACWEQWNGEDIDAVCSDGLVAGGAGHQRRPARSGPWLFYVDEGRPMLATARELVWDDDDPLATPQGPRENLPGAYRGAAVPAGVRYALPELPGQWRVDVWEDGAWVPRGDYTAGEMLTAQDAVRLVRVP